jgi:hypothetical protein
MRVGDACSARTSTQRGAREGERVKGERVKGERVKGERVKGERVKGERWERERTPTRSAATRAGSLGEIDSQAEWDFVGASWGWHGSGAAIRR